MSRTSTPPSSICLVSAPFAFLRRGLAALIFTLFFNSAQAQISPPGVGSTRGVTWGAIGLTQHLGTRWVGGTYIGMARESDPDNWALFKKQALLVLNQEVGYGFHPHWQLSVAGSFRRQSEYSAEAPFELMNPAHKKEVRYYSRLQYKHQLRQVAMTYTFRPEWRTFYHSSEKPLATPQEIRIRLKAQASVALNQAHSNFLIGGNELLTATDKSPENIWSAYHFTEDRLSVYFRHVFVHSPLSVDLGLMEQFKPHGHKTSYLAFDLLLQDPFGKHAAH